MSDNKQLSPDENVTKVILITYQQRITIETDDYIEARNIFAEKFPNAIPKEFMKCDQSEGGSKIVLDHKEVIGICEDTGKAIFEDDAYDEYEDGVFVLVDLPEIMDELAQKEKGE